MSGDNNHRQTHKERAPPRDAHQQKNPIPCCLIDTSCLENITAIEAHSLNPRPSLLNGCTKTMADLYA